MPDKVLPTARIRTFHPRRSRMSPTAAAALARNYDRFVATPGARLDPPSSVFGRQMPVVLEIGSGMGHATALMAAAEPDVGLLAVDVHTPGIAALVARCEREQLENIRVVVSDALEVLEEMIPEQSLVGIRAYFPDPWPKTRHHKRRLLTPSNVSLMVSRLAVGGTIHFATDVSSYALAARTALESDRRLANTVEGFLPRPAWRPETGFERAALLAGRPVSELLFERCS